MSMDNYSRKRAFRLRGGTTRFQKKPLACAVVLALAGAALPATGWAGTTIQGTVFYDLNGNSTFDACEIALPNYQVFIEDLTLKQAGNNAKFTPLTDGKGHYLFTSDNTGNFDLWVDIPNGMELSSPIKSVTSFKHQTSGGEDKTIDFGFYLPTLVNNPPVVTLLMPKEVALNEPVEFKASFTDPEGHSACSASPPTWFFGDGSSAQGLNVTHTYTQTGTFTATIKVVDMLGGIGEGSATITVGSFEPEIKVSTSAVNFGSKVVRSSSYQIITITNVGNALLQTGNLNISGTSSTEFQLFNSCSNKTLQPSQTCSLYTRFQPNSEGQKDATLVVPSNSGDQNVLLKAEATLPPPNGSQSEQGWCKDADENNTPQPITLKARLNNGQWFDQETWIDVTTGSKRMPDVNDVVFIPDGITVSGPETSGHIVVKSVCNKGVIRGNILITPTDKKTNSLEIYATDSQYGISNYGKILGATGGFDTNFCGTPGGDVLLIAGQKNVKRSPKRGDWWWYSYSSGGYIYNEGIIQGGPGGSDIGGTNCSADVKKGGNAIVLGRNVANIKKGTGEGGTIRAGNGGSDSNGNNPGGKGGLTQVWGKLGGSGYLVSNGAITGGKGGNGSTGGKGGNLWLVSLPNVYINGKAAGDATHKPGDGGVGSDGKSASKGSLTIEPSSIAITNTSLVGGEINIFGGNDWTLDLHQMNGTITSEGDVTLAVGQGGVIDLTGNNQLFLKAGGKVTLFSDVVFTDEGVELTDLIQATEIITKPSKVLRSIALTGVNQVLKKPGEKAPVSIKLANNGAEMDTYTLRVTDSNGWVLSELPGEIPVDGLDVVELPLDVDVPNQEGATNTITVTATSQTDSSITSTITIQVITVVEAQSGHALFGVLKNKRGNPIAEATIQISDQTTTTDADGNWEITGLTEGNYNIVATKDSFVFLPENIELTANSADKQEITLSIDKEPFDVWILDPTPDDGSEPGKATRIWASPDVWVRNQDDGGTRYQNVIFGQDNYVYVNVRNRGTLNIQNTTVEVYRSGASLGQGWPRGWELVGTAEVASLESQASETVRIKWDKEKIAKPGHYCFYVRLLNDDDPMFALETNNMVQNTKTNNNIAWRNFNVVGLLTKVTDKFEVAVGNPTDTPVVIDLLFDEPENLLQNDGARAIVDLGAELFQRWQDAGGQGENIQVLNGTEIQLLATPAKLIGIALDVGEDLPITMRVDAFEPAPGAGTSREYQFSTQEFIDGELVGGVEYAITTRAQDTDSDGDGIRDVEDDDNDNDGIPDTWEIEHGLNPLGEADASEDIDGDGQSNLEEFEGGTDPSTPPIISPDASVYVVKGIVQGVDNQSMAGVTVQIADRTVVTNTDGTWEIDSLLSGKYTATFSKAGYSSYTKDIVVSINEAQDSSYVSIDKITLRSLLEISVLTSPSRPLQGADLTYTITVTNKGETTATGLTLTEILPDSVTLLVMESESGGACDENTLNCILPDLAAGASATITIRVKTTEAVRLVNTITVSSNEYPEDVVTRQTTVLPYLSVSLSDNPDPVPLNLVQGESLRYTATIKLDEQAIETASGVHLKLNLPTGLQLQGISTDNGICDTTQLPKVLCDLTNLEVGSSVSVTIDTQLQDLGLLTFTAIAEVSADNYPTHKDRERTNIQIPAGVEVDMALVIDDTGSMQQEIDSAKEALKQFIANIDPSQSPLIAFITFKDEATVRFFGRDLNILLKEIDNLKASGGGTCPEASVEALNAAVPHVKQGGNILFVTDASPYDDADIEGLAGLLRSKAIRLTSIVTGDCSNTNSWNNLEDSQ